MEMDWSTLKAETQYRPRRGSHWMRRQNFDVVRADVKSGLNRFCNALRCVSC